jgi:hypothetical protein
VAEISSIQERYPGYNWGGEYTLLRRLSTAFMICAWGSIALSAAAAFGLYTRIPYPLSPLSRLIIAAAALILGMVLFLLFAAVSRLITAALDIEKNIRYTANVWMILEERDLGEEP